MCITIAGGVALYFAIDRLRSLAAVSDQIAGVIGPQRLYDSLMDGIIGVGEFQNRLIFSAYMRYYISIVVITFSAALIAVLAFEADLDGILKTPDARFYELGVAGIIVVAAIALTFLRSRLGAVAALGVVGYGVALIFIMFSAPDLAMTQFAIETLTVVLFVLVIYRLPTFKPLSTTRARVRDAVIACTVGGIMTTLVLIITSNSLESRLTPFFAASSYVEAKGQNVVNVILVDFRGFDTMGEITVLAIAAIGVYALLKLNLNQPDDGEQSNER